MTNLRNFNFLNFKKNVGKVPIKFPGSGSGFFVRIRIKMVWNQITDFYRNIIIFTEIKEGWYDQNYIKL